MSGSPEDRYIAQLEIAIDLLIDALYIQHECGEPKCIFLPGWECEGWEFTHPDGREWCERGIREDGPPMHPTATEAIQNAERILQ